MSTLSKVVLQHTLVEHTHHTHHTQHTLAHYEPLHDKSRDAPHAPPSAYLLVELLVVAARREAVVVHRVGVLEPPFDRRVDGGEVLDAGLRCGGGRAG